MEVVPKMALWRGSDAGQSRNQQTYQRGGVVPTSLELKWRDNFPEGSDHPVTPNHLELLQLRCQGHSLFCSLIYAGQNGRILAAPAVINCKL